MKVYLDDIREAYIGWKRTYTVKETIDLLSTGHVTHVSLDHDLTIAQTLGQDDKEPTGYDVLLWIEEQVVNNPKFVLPIVHIHTANPSARIKMESALASIVARYNKRLVP